MSFESDLLTFMAATRRLESGSFEGNYGARGRTIPSGNYARGAYQIMSHIWGGWAAAAGIPGADPYSKEAQDRVARYQMTRYYNQWNNWKLVAVAWYSGGSRAESIHRRFGSDATDAEIRSVVGSSILDYSQKVVDRYAAEAPESEWGRSVGLVPLGGEGGSPLPPEEGMPTDGEEPESLFRNESVYNAGQTMRNVLGQMADAQSVGGRRLSIEDVETQRITSPDEVEEPLEGVADGSEQRIIR